MKTSLFLAAALAALAALPAVAGQYPVEVDLQSNGLDIEVRPSAGAPLVVTFVSRDKVDAVCRVEVASGLDTPQQSGVTVKAGQRATATVRLGSAPNRVRLAVTCKPKG